MNVRERAELLGLEIDEFRELFELFIETGRADLAELEQAVQQHEGERIGAAAHSLKGASINLGFPDLSGLAESIVLDARRGKLDHLEETVRTLRKAFDAVVERYSGSGTGRQS